MVTLVEDGPTTYDIVLEDGTTVGFIKGSLSTLTQIDIKKKYRGEGYGTDALEEYIQLAQENGEEVIETTTVINPIFENILQSYGFEQTDEFSNNTYRYELEN